MCRGASHSYTHVARDAVPLQAFGGAFHKSLKDTKTATELMSGF